MLEQIIGLGNESHSNALVSTAFTLSFSEFFTEKEINLAESIYRNNEQIQKDLPTLQHSTGVTVQLDAQQVIQTSQQLTKNGISFSSFLNTGKIAWSVRLVNNMFIVECNDYSRWNIVWEKVQNYFLLFESCFENLNLVDIGLECVDEFRILDLSADWKAVLFKSDSTFLSKTILEEKDFWHIHQGYFTCEDDIRTLNNVNINYFRDDSVVGSSPYKVIIQCSHKTIVADINIIKYTRENIMNFVEKNHNINKKVLIDLLSTDICKKIKLVVEK